MKTDEEEFPTKKCEFKGELVGEIASIITVLALVPFAWYITTTGDVQNINIFWMLLKLVAIVMWLYFSWINAIVPNIICYVGISALFLYIIGCKIFLGARKSN